MRATSVPRRWVTIVVAIAAVLVVAFLAYKGYDRPTTGPFKCTNENIAGGRTPC